MTKHVCLISGKMSNGKNKFSDYLQDTFEKYNKSVKMDLFAKDLKDSCKVDFKNLCSTLYDISEKLKTIVGLMHERSVLDDNILEQLYTIIDKELKIKDENWYENKNEITRSLLQIYGTNIFRDRVDENWWAAQTKNRVLNNSEDITILTDCRFPNEIEIFNSTISDNFKIHPIRIERNINTNKGLSTHESELALDNWNEWEYIVDNNGTLKDLKSSAKIIVEDILSTEEE